MYGNIRIVGAAFGPPNSERVFSGVSRHLFQALEKRARMVGYISTKQLRPWDLFSGAMDLARALKYHKLGISRAWLWRPETIDKLSRRLRTALRKVNNFNTVLQIGTHARLDLDGIRHYCFTDMTVSQAAKGKQFGLGRLSDLQIAKAIQAQKAIFQSCRDIFVNSYWAKQSITQDYGIEPAKVHVVGVGASIPDHWYRHDEQKAPNILFIGRDWLRKGGPILLQAFKLVRNNCPDATLTIMGCSPDISDRGVSVLGPIDKNVKSHEQTLCRALRRATVLCVPSVFEPYGICFLEAQLMAVPPVTFTGQGRSDAIKNNVTGILIEQRTPEALSKALLEPLQNPQKAREMGKRGREFVKNHLSWDKVAERILAVMQTEK